MKKVLVVDDEKLIVKGLKFSLEQDDMEVDVAYDGGEAFEKIKNNDYDIVLLDIMIPVYTGIEVCQMVREFSNVPIIMLTAKGEDMDKIMGLEYGADDYITKPFNILEVKARIKAILRRSGKKAEPVKPVNILEINGMKVELDSRRVFVHGKELNLTAKEFDLLELLMAHPNKVYSRNELLDTIWGSTYPGDARTVDVHVRRLREKIEENPGEPVYIHTKCKYYTNAKKVKVVLRMGINEQSQKLMDKIRAKKGKPLFLNTVEAVREANIKQYCTNPPLVEIGRTEDQFVPCPWGTLRIKLYYPKDTGDAGLLPVVVFYHGGGWTVDTVETHDKAVHVMCAASGCVFASVDYRLAPEHKFPAGL